jgi:predicted ATPase
MKLNKISLQGYKSIGDESQTIELGDLTLLIGSNGAGKSNLISLFSMLNYLTTGALQNYIGARGFADSFLYMSSAKTTQMKIELCFFDQENRDVYRFVLAHAVGGSMVFTDETIEWQQKASEKPYVKSLGNGHQESLLESQAKDGDKACLVIQEHLSRLRTFHFHNTEITAKIRDKGFIEDNRYLRSDAGNLAAFLYAMQKNDNRYYQRIRSHIQEVFPQFEDFDLQPATLNPKYIELNWRSKGSDMLWGAHQISDGSLRFMALMALLLQPPRTMPNAIILDEPELGLHPSAIIKLSALLKSVSPKVQILVATQSAMLLNEISPDDVCVVEFDPRKQCSVYKKQDAKKLGDWLKDYTLSQLWEKNILGGKP